MWLRWINVPSLVAAWMDVNSVKRWIIRLAGWLRWVRWMIWADGEWWSGGFEFAIDLSELVGHVRAQQSPSSQLGLLGELGYWGSVFLLEC